MAQEYRTSNDRVSGEGRHMATVLVVDIQVDFTEWKKGSLAVPGTDEAYIREVLQTSRRLRQAGYPVLATQDRHPADHVSFFTSPA